MTVSAIEIDALGEARSGVQVQLPLEEAKAIRKLLLQAMLYPPTSADGRNTDYATKGVGQRLLRALEEVGICNC
jgi:hypothetical protein